MSLIKLLWISWPFAMKKILLLVSLGLLLSTCTSSKWSCNYEPTHTSLDQICGISVPIDSMVYYKNTHEPIQVYRVWDETKPWTLYGRWWSLEEPRESKEEYRKANAICPEWNDLNDVASAQGEASKMARDFELGRENDLSKVMVSQQVSSLGFQLTLNLRNKALSAYKDIMNMPV